MARRSRNAPDPEKTPLALELAARAFPEASTASRGRRQTPVPEPSYRSVDIGFPSERRLVAKWDYKTVALTGGFMGRYKDELKRSDLETQFDALGQEGWELSWILMNQSLQGEKDGHVVIFKRPLPE
jgi:hypothetical protein